MNKADLIWWPDDKKGVIINAVAARDRATPSFVFTRALRLVFPMPIMVLASYLISTTLTFPTIPLAGYSPGSNGGRLL